MGPQIFLKNYKVDHWMYTRIFYQDKQDMKHDRRSQSFRYLMKKWKINLTYDTGSIVFLIMIVENTEHIYFNYLLRQKSVQNGEKRYISAKFPPIIINESKTTPNAKPRICIGGTLSNSYNVLLTGYKNLFSVASNKPAILSHRIIKCYSGNHTWYVFFLN